MISDADIYISRGQSSLQLYKMKISLVAMMEEHLVVVPMRMMRASTRTSKPSLNQRSAKSLTKIIKVILIAMLRWTTRMTTMLRQKRRNWWNGQRRNRRPRNEKTATNNV